MCSAPPTESRANRWQELFSSKASQDLVTLEWAGKVEQEFLNDLTASDVFPSLSGCVDNDFFF